MTGVVQLVGLMHRATVIALAQFPVVTECVLTGFPDGRLRCSRVKQRQPALVQVTHHAPVAGDGDRESFGSVPTCAGFSLGGESVDVSRRPRNCEQAAQGPSKELEKQVWISPADKEWPADDKHFATAPWTDGGVDIRKTGRRVSLACVQHHHLVAGRDLVRSGTLADYERVSATAARRTEPFEAAGVVTT